MNSVEEIVKLARSHAPQSPSVAARVQAAMDTMPEAECFQRMGRVLFRAQTEREPTAAELTVYLRDGLFDDALTDPRVFENLASQATKAGEHGTARTWSAVAELVATGDPNAELLVFSATLETTIAIEFAACSQ